MNDRVQDQVQTYLNNRNNPNQGININNNKGFNTPFINNNNNTNTDPSGKKQPVQASTSKQDTEL